MLNNKLIQTFHSYFSIQYTYSFLFGMLGGIVVAFIVQLYALPPKKIMTVNVTAIVSEFIQHETKKNMPQADLTKEVKAFGVSLETTLKAYAKNNNVILLPREAVIDGSEDATATIEAFLIQ